MDDDNEQRVVIVPGDRLWFDPRVIVSTCTLTPDRYSILSGANRLLLPADPTRVLLTIFNPITGMGDIRVAPWTNPDEWWLAKIPIGSSETFRLFDHMLYVTTDWWISVGGNQDVFVAVTRRN